MSTMFIIGCSQKKQQNLQDKAINLYDGPLWTTLRKHQVGDEEVLALSALYGLIDSETVISNYDCLLGRDVTDDKFKIRIDNSLGQIASTDPLEPGATFLVFTSKRYFDCFQTVFLRRKMEGNLVFIAGGIGDKRKSLRICLEIEQLKQERDLAIDQADMIDYHPHDMDDQDRSNLRRAKIKVGNLGDQIATLKRSIPSLHQKPAS